MGENAFLGCFRLSLREVADGNGTRLARGGEGAGRSGGTHHRRGLLTHHGLGSGVEAAARRAEMEVGSLHERELAYRGAPP